MSERLLLRVPPQDDGGRLDVVLARLAPEHSRSRLAELIRAGLVKVQSRVASKPSYRVVPGDAIEVDIPTVVVPSLGAEAIAVPVLFEDDEILVVDKPAGMVVHPAHGHGSGTLVNALIGRPLAPAPADEPWKPGIVHRLDKDTSGCLVVAKTAWARADLERQFRNREVGKVYLAVVLGLPPSAGVIAAPVGRDMLDRKKMSTRSRRTRTAYTEFEVVERFGASALLRVRIATGRTHQIRVHLASIGHAVVGDRLYGGQRPRQPLPAFPRQALHAHELRVRHPRSGVTLVFSAELPMDMEGLLGALRALGQAPDERRGGGKERG